MDNLPLILVEVHSSPFATTVKKTILGVTDQLRLYRTYDASITRCVGFAFPKKDFKQCVVIVSVTWEKLCFRYTLTPIEKIESVRSTIERELCAATESAPSPGLNQELRFLVNNSVGWHSWDLTYACLYPQKHFVLPSFVFFAFPLGKFEMDQLKEWCKKPDPNHRESYKSEETQLMPFFFLHTLFSLLFVVALL